VKLFHPDQLVGTFRGFSEGGLEFHADLMLGYQSRFQNVPMHGQFLVVQLESEDEAVLGRITNLHAEGRLASASGDDFALRALKERREIPENLRDQYLKYRVGIRVLGVLRETDEGLVFVPSHRRLPHVGSPVAFLSDEVLREVVGHNVAGAELGYFALGEFVFCGDDKRIERLPWMIARNPTVIARFEVKNLVSRRSFVFARAGFGKSNLIKLLFSDLYVQTPTTEKRGARQVPVGTIIFDPDGEYFWPDDKNRPGLCDVPTLQDKVVVFTNRQGPSPFYHSFVAGPIKMDVRRLPASSVVAITISPDRQTQQNVIKLRRLDAGRWQQLVDLIYRERMQARDEDIATILNLRVGNDDAEIGAARSNMMTIVEMLHDPSSQLLDKLMEALKAGKLCVIDISQMRGNRGRVLGGLLLQRIFDHNQNEWTKAQPETIPVIAVIEEAQSVLSDMGRNNEDPYVVWTKEGRKYDLGSVLVTQQPGSIDNELLSQGDNWFIFHLLSAQDLLGLKKANSHFSDDLLSSLLNEPIPGNGVFWSSAGGQSYPIPFRPLAFEKVYQPLDAKYSKGPVDTFAAHLKDAFAQQVADMQAVVPLGEPDLNLRAGAAGEDDDAGEVPVDILESAKAAAIAHTMADTALRRKLESKPGHPWKGVLVALESHLPATMSDREQLAYQLVPRFMNEAFGEGRWETQRRDKRDDPQRKVTWLVIKDIADPPRTGTPGHTDPDDIPF
jgi:uncharacterized protein